MTEKELVSMPLHTIARVKNVGKVIRVVGGWIYMFDDSMGIKVESSVFVPAPEQFDEFEIEEDD